MAEREKTEREKAGHPAVERMRDRARGDSGRSAYRTASLALFWILVFGAVVLIGGFSIVYNIFSDRDVVYLSRAPIQARIERFATSANSAGSCEIEVWRLTEASRERLRREGLDLLLSPHRFAPGWPAAAWRSLDGDVGPDTPWNPAHCPNDVRRDFVAWAEERPSYLAVLRRPGKDGAAPEAAVFLIAPQSGVFARAVFSLRTTTPLDPEA